MLKKTFVLCRRNRNLYIICSLSIIFVFLLYEIILLNDLSLAIKNEATSNSQVIKLIIGVHLQLMPFYENKNKKFTCIKSMEEILYTRVNDDYCDCVDGTDEPSTNACSNGVFYCTKQISLKKYKNMIPSSKVNDGVCDCCDGSDEYDLKKLERILKRKKKLTSHRNEYCPKLC